MNLPQRLFSNPVTADRCFVDKASYILKARFGGEMTKDQMRDEHDRLQGVLEAHEARAVASSIPDHHHGLRQRIAGLALKLAETNVA